VIKCSTVRQTIAFLSQGTTLKLGGIILTGTPRVLGIHLIALIGS
jgi:2-keto-4-pentenoate hydratase/2-oxohepta-3-ene-1,7-dioic acid hydratase in catechol pathway